MSKNKAQLKAKVESVSHNPNRAIRVKQGHLLRKIGRITYVKRPMKPWAIYRGDYGYAGPFQTRNVSLPLGQAQKVLEERLGGRVYFRYTGREPIYLKQQLGTTTIRCKEAEIILPPKPKRNIELALRAVICRLEWLLGASGTYQPSKETNNESDNTEG